MRIGYLQYEPRFGDWEGNAHTAEALASGVGEAALLVLPELALTGYDFPTAKDALDAGEPLTGGRSCAWAQALARKLGLTLVLGFPERVNDAVYNASMLVMPDGTVHGYRKTHLFSREKSLFRPGESPPPVVETPAGRVGVMICFDWYFPETMRLLALGGAQIVAHPSNLVLPHCQRAMITRCIENRVFAITANRIGTEELAGRRLTFTGASQVVSARGEVLVSAPADTPHAATVDVDPALADNKHVTEFNDLFADRRTDLYGRIVTD